MNFKSWGRLTNINSKAKPKVKKTIIYITFSLLDPLV
jgi:hypothetical protein